MERQEECLKKLIGSFNEVSIGSMGMSKVGLDFYRNENGNVLIHIGSLNKEVTHEYLSENAVISKNELFMTLFTGCTGPSSIDIMLSSFDEYHGESGSSALVTFLQSLEAHKVVICYNRSNGGPKAALVVLYHMCQKINVDCIPIIIKPALFYGNKNYFVDFKSLIGYFETPNYHIYDIHCLVHRLRHIGDTLRLDEIDRRVEEELLTIASSMVRS